MEIKTARLTIRDYRIDGSELEPVISFVSDSRVAQHTSWGSLTGEEALAWMNAAIAAQIQVPRLVYELAIVESDGERLIGNCSMHIRSSKNSEAEIGYTLRVDAWGRGYGTEAAKAILAFGFSQLHLHRIYASTSPLNQASQGVLKKIGMQREGVLRKNVLKRGQWRDSVIFSILEEEFAPKGP